MAAIEVKAIGNLLGTPFSYAYAVKAGNWIFLNGHEAFDFAGGIPQDVAGPAGFPMFGQPRSRREGDFILGRMRRILGELGSDLTHGVRLDQYYPNPKAVAEYVRGDGTVFCRRHDDIQFDDRGGPRPGV